jgi:hypothetical protein
MTSAWKANGGSIGRGGSRSISGNSIATGGGMHRECSPNAGSGAITSMRNSHTAARSTTAQPSPRPLPTTMTAGRNATARNLEERPMRAPDQRLGKGGRP